MTKESKKGTQKSRNDLAFNGADMVFGYSLKIWQTSYF